MPYGTGPSHLQTFLLMFQIIWASPFTSLEFDYDVTSKIIFPMTAGRFKNNQMNGLRSFETITNYSYVDFFGQNARCGGYVAIAPKEQLILVAFKGTVPESQLAAAEEWSDSQVPWSYGEGLVDSYFSNAFEVSFNQDSFKNLYQEYPHFKVIIGGYSLGGAIAILAASWMVETKLIQAVQLQVTTFGQSRVGNSVFAERFDETVSNAYQIL